VERFLGGSFSCRLDGATFDENSVPPWTRGTSGGIGRGNAGGVGVALYSTTTPGPLGPCPSQGGESFSSSVAWHRGMHGSSPFQSCAQQLAKLPALACINARPVGTIRTDSICRRLPAAATLPSPPTEVRHVIVRREPVVTDDPAHNPLQWVHQCAPKRWQSLGKKESKRAKRSGSVQQSSRVQHRDWDARFRGHDASDGVRQSLRGSSFPSNRGSRNYLGSEAKEANRN